MEKGHCYDVQLKGCSIPQSNSIKCLGVTVDRELKWSHICRYPQESLCCDRLYTESESLPSSVHTYVRCSTKLWPFPTWTTVLLCGSPAVTQGLTHSIKRIQNYAKRVILSTPLRIRLGWSTLHKGVRTPYCAKSTTVSSCRLPPI